MTRSESTTEESAGSPVVVRTLRPKKEIDYFLPETDFFFHRDDEDDDEYRDAGCDGSVNAPDPTPVTVRYKRPRALPPPKPAAPIYKNKRLIRRGDPLSLFPIILKINTDHCPLYRKYIAQYMRSSYPASGFRSRLERILATHLDDIPRALLRLDLEAAEAETLAVTGGGIVGDPEMMSIVTTMRAEFGWDEAATPQNLHAILRQETTELSVFLICHPEFAGRLDNQQHIPATRPRHKKLSSATCSQDVKSALLESSGNASVKTSCSEMEVESKQTMNEIVLQENPWMYEESVLEDVLQLQKWN